MFCSVCMCKSCVWCEWAALQVREKDTAQSHSLLHHNVEHEPLQHWVHLWCMYTTTHHRTTDHIYCTLHCRHAHTQTPHREAGVTCQNQKRVNMSHSKFVCFAIPILATEARQRQIACRIINLHAVFIVVVTLVELSLHYLGHHCFLGLHRTVFHWAGELCECYAVWSGVKQQPMVKDWLFMRFCTDAHMQKYTYFGVFRPCQPQSWPWHVAVGTVRKDPIKIRTLKLQSICCALMVLAGEDINVKHCSPMVLG